MKNRNRNKRIPGQPRHPLVAHVDRLADALRQNGVELPRAKLVEVTSSTLGFRNSHEAVAASKAGRLGGAGPKPEDAATAAGPGHPADLTGMPDAEAFGAILRRCVSLGVTPVVLLIPQDDERVLGQFAVPYPAIRYVTLAEWRIRDAKTFATRVSKLFPELTSRKTSWEAPRLFGEGVPSSVYVGSRPEGEDTSGGLLRMDLDWSEQHDFPRYAALMIHHACGVLEAAVAGAVSHGYADDVLCGFLGPRQFGVVTMWVEVDGRQEQVSSAANGAFERLLDVFRLGMSDGGDPKGDGVHLPRWPALPADVEGLRVWWGDHDLDGATAQTFVVRVGYHNAVKVKKSHDAERGKPKPVVPPPPPASAPPRRVPSLKDFDLSAFFPGMDMGQVKVTMYDEFGNELPGEA